jgi:hypothetical protein
MSRPGMRVFSTEFKQVFSDSRAARYGALQGHHINCAISRSSANANFRALTRFLRAATHRTVDLMEA